MRRTRNILRPIAAAFTAIGGLALLPCSVSAQVSLGSIEEDYYRLLSVSNAIERPTMNYRTLSDNTWLVPVGVGPWDREGSADAETARVKIRVYGPELFASYNSAYPHGMNDGALWQGVGLNSSLGAGLRIEAFGIEATLKPTILWEQNGDFPIMPSSGTNEYGYYIAGIDLPQRLGDGPRLDFDWGDTEIRYSWRGLTIGFGTQAAWIGPARQNAIILSNTGPGFPKLDFGLRRTATAIGDIEARCFWGRLEASEYDTAAADGTRLLTATSMSWSPRFFPELTLGFHRTMLSYWSDDDYAGMLTLLIPAMDVGAGADRRDQRASLTADLSFPSVGFEAYVEWARNDFSSNFRNVLMDPSHSQAFTFGGSKSFTFSDRSILCLNGEITQLINSRSYILADAWNLGGFYGHWLINQGYSVEGQSLGAGIGPGANEQYAECSYYWGEGAGVAVFLSRINRNQDYLLFRYPHLTNSLKRTNVEMTIGLSSESRLAKNISLRGELAFSRNLNVNYESNSDIDNYRASLTTVFNL